MDIAVVASLFSAAACPHTTYRFRDGDVTAQVNFINAVLRRIFAQSCLLIIFQR
jgi:hypothetical protein